MPSAFFKSKTAPGGGVGSMAPGTVVSTRQRGGRVPVAAAGAWKSERDDYTKMISEILERQRKQQAKLFKQARGQISKTGKAEDQRLRESGQKTAALGTQRLMSRGLGNTTIQSGFERGVEADTQRNLTEASDRRSMSLASLFAREGGLQLGEGQLGLQGAGMQSGGLEDYIKLMTMLQGGLS